MIPRPTKDPPVVRGSISPSREHLASGIASLPRGDGGGLFEESDAPGSERNTQCHHQPSVAQLQKTVQTFKHPAVSISVSTLLIFQGYTEGWICIITGHGRVSRCLRQVGAQTYRLSSTDKPEHVKQNRRKGKPPIGEERVVRQRSGSGKKEYLVHEICALLQLTPSTYQRLLGRGKYLLNLKQISPTTQNLW